MVLTEAETWGDDEMAAEGKLQSERRKNGVRMQESLYSEFDGEGLGLELGEEAMLDSDAWLLTL